LIIASKTILKSAFDLALSDFTSRNILMAFNISADELPSYGYLARATNSQTLSESNNEFKLTAARDSGIRPLILKFEDFINSGKEDNIDDVFNFKKSLIDYGFEKTLVNDWLKVRKTKKATNSETAFNNFIKQIEENGNDKNKILEQLVNKSWSGFNSDWKLEIQQNNTKEYYDEGMAKRAKENFEKGTMTKERIREVYFYDIDTDKFTKNLKPW
jgi:hypothetical protein